MLHKPPTIASPGEASAETSKPRGPRLWLRLWFAYTALCSLGMSALMVLSSTTIDAQNFVQTYTAENLARALAAEADALMTAEGGAPSAEALSAILLRLKELQSPNENQLKFELNMVSQPEAAIRIRDADGRLLAQNQSAGFPGALASAGGISAEVSRMTPSGARTLAATVIAPHNLPMNISAKVEWVVSMAPITLLTSAIIGLVCGLVSARYVTWRLDLIDSATAQWRLGNFSRLIDIDSGDELETHARRLNAMASELETHLNLKQAVAVSDERNRIARELHDTVKQNLFALGLQLAVLRNKLDDTGTQGDGSHEANLAEAENITREAQQDLMEIINQLRPTRDDAETLGALVTKAAEGYARRLPVNISVRTETDFKVPPKTEFNLLRIMQEAVSNAVRHGGATAIEISLKRPHDTAELIVADNGSGFDVAGAAKGLGLQSVEQRVDELPGGRFAISSSPGEGAALTVNWRPEEA